MIGSLKNDYNLIKFKIKYSGSDDSFYLGSRVWNKYNHFIWSLKIIFKQLKITSFENK